MGGQADIPHASEQTSTKRVLPSAPHWLWTQPPPIQSPIQLHLSHTVSRVGAVWFQLHLRVEGMLVSRMTEPKMGPTQVTANVSVALFLPIAWSWMIYKRSKCFHSRSQQHNLNSISFWCETKLGCCWHWKHWTIIFSKIFVLINKDHDVSCLFVVK